MLAIAGAVLVAVNAALIVAVARFRSARGKTVARVRGGRGIQLRAVFGLAIIAIAIFIAGIVYSSKARDVAPSGPNGLQASNAQTAQLGTSTPPTGGGKPVLIRVTGQQWLWRFDYGNQPPPTAIFSYGELVVPVDTTVILSLDSTDVLDRWSIPELGGHFDAVPGHTNETWFRADRTGIYRGQSSAFSGQGYATMRAWVKVVTPTAYKAWLSRQKKDIQTAQAYVQRKVAAAGPEGFLGTSSP